MMEGASNTDAELTKAIANAMFMASSETNKRLMKPIPVDNLVCQDSPSCGALGKCLPCFVRQHDKFAELGDGRLFSKALKAIFRDFVKQEQTCFVVDFIKDLEAFMFLESEDIQIKARHGDLKTWNQFVAAFVPSSRKVNSKNFPHRQPVFDALTYLLSTWNLTLESPAKWAVVDKNSHGAHDVDRRWQACQLTPPRLEDACAVTAPASDCVQQSAASSPMSTFAIPPYPVEKPASMFDFRCPSPLDEELFAQLLEDPVLFGELSNTIASLPASQESQSHEAMAAFPCDEIFP
ncbi:uncharacterized protein MONBRDRAFT_32142 [Monosiga brevicollis MX1]|uniref:Uncharacterized protein n=1 Tax=Monosiga brevicollis TaxID=81824 RepID=A9UXX2_MONBE|nr:uncharacterized protein MONBRDRAFT_32142 [Monosiga brevicollis MX1]EDQ89760.1 predicted protein [Monosiga brevicollis MX1]|eukprot:XP_001745182.1 hypothetical protein [Monosiga brevicollis MX1]